MVRMHVRNVLRLLSRRLVRVNLIGILRVELYLDLLLKGLAVRNELHSSLLPLKLSNQLARLC